MPAVVDYNDIELISLYESITLYIYILHAITIYIVRFR